MVWVIIDPPTDEDFTPILVEDRWITGQRGGYASDTPGATTLIGTRGAKAAVSAGWTVIEKPALATPLRGGWADETEADGVGGYSEPNKRGGLADTGDGWMTILMPLEPPSP